MGKLIDSPVLGPVDVKQDEIYTFAHGIPGFEACRQFVILRPEPDSPFAYLQSADRPELVLLVANPFFFYPAYDFEFPEAAAEELGLTAPEDAVVWSVVTIPEKLEMATLNLAAPIVVNPKTRKGRQTILTDHAYTTKHPLLEPRVAAETPGGGGGDAGSHAQEG